MQDRPDKNELLRAIALFLQRDLRPTVEDKGLQFRVLIAANLARMVADEIESEDQNNVVELAGLRALLPDESSRLEPNLDPSDRLSAITLLRNALAAKIRDEGIAGQDAAFAFLKRDLVCKLSTVNPKFTTKMEIE